jgi:hypothetical protein
MNESAPESIGPNFASESDSRDCVNVFWDAVGDQTVRPCRPELLPRLLAERERLARVIEQMRQEGIPLPEGWEGFKYGPGV